MDLEKLEKMANLVLKKLNSHSYARFQINPHLEVEFKNLMVLASNSLPDYRELFILSYKKVSNTSEAKSVVRHILEILEIEKSSALKIKEDKIFEGVEDKLKQASTSFRQGNFSSVFHTLNTALELVLKDKVEIPTTLTGINTSNVIELLVKEKVHCYRYLDEAKKRVTLIDNKIKHVGYTPTEPECISALKAVHELMSKLKNKEIKISEELRNKIFTSLYDRKEKSKS